MKRVDLHEQCRRDTDRNIQSLNNVASSEDILYYYAVGVAIYDDRR